MRERQVQTDPGRSPSGPTESRITVALQMAVAALQSGQLDDAERHATSVLAAYHQNAGALIVMGWIALNRDRFDEAIASFERVRVIQSKDASVRFGLGEAHRRKGDFSRALRHFRKAALLRPEYAEAHAQIGETLRALGRSAEAAEAYRTALALQPDLAHCLHGFGLLLAKDGRPEQAVPLFEAASCATPAHMVAEQATVLANLGRARMDAGDTPGAIAALSEAVDVAPDEPAYWRLLAESLSNVKEVPSGSGFRKALVALFRREDVDPRLLATAAVAAMKQDPTIEGLLNALAESPAQAEHALAASSTTIKAILQDELLLALLSATPIRDVGLELLLTWVRRDLLMQSGAQSGASFDLICGLARQCFLNEYVFWVGPDEDAALVSLWASCDPAGRVEWNRIAVLACYFALERRLPWSVDLTAAPEPLRTLLGKQVQDAADERVLCEKVVTFKPVRDAVSLVVQQQYEENPYPRWTRCQMGTPQRFREAVTLALPHVEELPATQAPRVLVAGCGTGIQIMNVLQTYADASVLAVDLSRSSLAYGMRKLREYGIHSVRQMQADILELGGLKDRFDLIESFGVLHHMRDPTEGLRVLAGLLTEGGLLFLGLYSQIARASVVAARELLSELALTPTPAGVRAGRRAIIARSADPELRPLLSPASDFWTLSECRDLIFHVEEHRFTLLEIQAMLDTCRLEFLGLELARPVDRVLFAVEHPDPAALRSLSAWHAFENRYPETFGDTYRIWARRA